MTKDERQALREKHWNCDPGELDLCNHCKDDYPCEVIQVLDSYFELQQEIAKIYHRYPPLDPYDQVQEMFIAAGGLT